MNVLHGKKSMSWAKSVLPLFTGTSSETFRKVPDPVQIDTALNRQNCIQNHVVKDRRPLLNRTAVSMVDKTLQQSRDMALETSGNASLVRVVPQIFDPLPSTASSVRGR